MNLNMRRRVGSFVSLVAIIAAMNMCSGCTKFLHKKIAHDHSHILEDTKYRYIVGIDTNNNGIYEQTLYYQNTTKGRELRSIHYDWNEDGKTDVLKNLSGYYIMRRDK